MLELSLWTIVAIAVMAFLCDLAFRVLSAGEVNFRPSFFLRGIG